MEKRLMGIILDVLYRQGHITPEQYRKIAKRIGEQGEVKTIPPGNGATSPPHV